MASQLPFQTFVPEELLQRIVKCNRHVGMWQSICFISLKLLLIAGLCGRNWLLGFICSHLVLECICRTFYLSLLGRQFIQLLPLTLQV